MGKKKNDANQNNQNSTTNDSKTVSSSKSSSLGKHPVEPINFATYENHKGQIVFSKKQIVESTTDSELTTEFTMGDAIYMQVFRPESPLNTFEVTSGRTSTLVTTALRYYIDGQQINQWFRDWKTPVSKVPYFSKTSPKPQDLTTGEWILRNWTDNPIDLGSYYADDYILTNSSIYMALMLASDGVHKIEVKEYIDFNGTPIELAKGGFSITVNAAGRNAFAKNFCSTTIDKYRLNFKDFVNWNKKCTSYPDAQTKFKNYLDKTLELGEEKLTKTSYQLLKDAEIVGVYEDEQMPWTYERDQYNLPVANALYLRVLFKHKPTGLYFFRRASLKTDQVYNSKHEGAVAKFENNLALDGSYNIDAILLPKECLPKSLGIK